MIKKTLLLFLLVITLAFYAIAQKDDPAFGTAIFKQELVTPGIKPDMQVGYRFNKNGADVFVEDIGIVIGENGCQLVERNIIGIILGELSLGSSELADPNMRTKLGRITLAAFCVFTDFTVDEDKAALSIRAVATETGELVYANTVIFKEQGSVEDVAEKEGYKIYKAINQYASEHVINIHEKTRK